MLRSQIASSYGLIVVPFNLIILQYGEFLVSSCVIRRCHYICPQPKNYTRINSVALPEKNNRNYSSVELRPDSHLANTFWFGIRVIPESLHFSKAHHMCRQL